ncbi:hypothetical protein DFH09DRAFT_1480820, partial [Mycena vulgaris]
FPPILPSLVLAVFKAPAPSLSHHICYSIIWHPPRLICPICREAFKYCQALWHRVTVEPRSLRSCSTDSPEWLTLKDYCSKMKIYQVFNAHIKLFVIKCQTQDELAVNPVLSLSSPPPHGLLLPGKIWRLHHACARAGAAPAPRLPTQCPCWERRPPQPPTAQWVPPPHPATASSPSQATPSALALPAQREYDGGIQPGVPDLAPRCQAELDHADWLGNIPRCAGIHAGARRRYIQRAIQIPTIDAAKRGTRPASPPPLHRDERT